MDIEISNVNGVEAVANGCAIWLGSGGDLCSCYQTAKR
jgi:hypothetical protein